ncbi:MAG: T9SS type A sorting domain-containing protein [Bacteroidia bacterium]|nr:T9SS type A sorting domain-containing protein [Bacteroidia bacterium]NNK71374.1 T9SS type A sorting domain-containing protein [Flavobacteriaceae bacterium]NNL79613.1 T9SS type A sorting domain-containing protein [Flavobacteriaceae bacterium]
MKTTTQKQSKTIMMILVFLTCQCIIAQVNPGQIDDFEDGTTQNWTDGGSSVPPVNISTGGPTGANDNFLQNVSLGANGPGSRQVMFNDQQWNGNYTSQGIISIKFHARALNNDLNMRIAFDGGGGRICTVTPVLVQAGGAWQQYTIPISASDFTTVAGGSNVSMTLADVTDMRILSNTSASWQGQSIAATLEIDNIEASTTLSTDNFSRESLFSMIPNISKNNLIIELAGALQGQKPIMEIYDPSGRLLLEEDLQNMTKIEIQVSNWPKGVYLVKIKNLGMEHTERFIKQ